MRLLRQRGAEIELHRTLARPHPEPDADLSPYLRTAHLGPVDLMAQHNRRKAAGNRRSERAPPAHHLPHRFFAPETETQRPQRDPRQQPVTLGPLGELETWDGCVAYWNLTPWPPLRNRSGGTRLKIPGAQSALPTRSAAYRCVRTRARSVRCSE